MRDAAIKECKAELMTGQLCFFSVKVCLLNWKKVRKMRKTGEVLRLLR